MATLPQEEPTKLLQAYIRPSVYRRLRVEKETRDLKTIAFVVDEILDASLPALRVADDDPKPKRKAS